MKPEAIVLTIIDGAAVPSRPIELPDLTGKRVLRLSLKKRWFDLMVTGEKTTEYRKASEWIKARLETSNAANLEYTDYLFTNGYGAHRPWFMCDAYGFGIAPFGFTTPPFSDGSTVDVAAGDYEIYLGPITASGNLPGCPDQTTGCGQCDSCQAGGPTLTE